MELTREHCRPVSSPSEAQIVRALSLMKSSYCALSAETGAYIQVAGGPGLFFVERHDVDGQHHRASQPSSMVPFPDGTTLSFSAGTIALASTEWLLANQVKELLIAFLAGEAFPSWVQWSPSVAVFGSAD